jgi:hypothetical protein
MNGRLSVVAAIHSASVSTKVAPGNSDMPEAWSK